MNNKNTKQKTFADKDKQVGKLQLENSLLKNERKIILLNLKEEIQRQKNHLQKIYEYINNEINEIIDRELKDK